MVAAPAANAAKPTSTKIYHGLPAGPGAGLGDGFGDGSGAGPGDGLGDGLGAGPGDGLGDGLGAGPGDGLGDGDGFVAHFPNLELAHAKHVLSFT